MAEGYIYCLSNPAMPGIVKIGEIHTEGRTPEDRIRELYTTGVPLPFVIEFAKRVINPAQKESRIHLFIEDTRVNPRREFFRTTPEYVRRLFDLIEGQMWEPEPTEEIVEQEGNGVIVNVGNVMSRYFTDGLQIRHIIGQDVSRTWSAVYNATTDRIVYNNISYTSLSDFALKHHRVYNPERRTANGWVECECNVNNNWIIARELREEN